MLQISPKYSEIMGKIGIERPNGRTPPGSGWLLPARLARMHVEPGNSRHESRPLHPPRHAGRSGDRRSARPGGRARARSVVRVAAAALNFFDLLIIAGKYQYKPAYPFSPAAEFAGTVESVGPGVTGFAAGDRVIGYCGWGAARERLAIAAEQAGQDARRPRFRPRGGPERDLRHLLLRAEGSRRAEARRDAGGARRLRRRRASRRSSSAS